MAMLHAEIRNHPPESHYAVLSAEVFALRAL